MNKLILTELKKISWLLRTALMQGEREMASIADIKTQVEAEKTVTDSAVALIGGLSSQLKAALAANDPAVVQTIIDELDAQKDELAAAVTANTPAVVPPADPATPAAGADGDGGNGG